MIDCNLVQELKNLCGSSHYVSSKEIFEKAKELVEADDGYEYVHAWTYGHSRGLYIGFNFNIKYYRNCPDEELNEAVYNFLKGKFPELELEKIEPPDYELDSYLPTFENYDLVIEAPHE